MLGFVDTEHAVFASATAPVTGVFAPMTKSPQMIMWDPQTYPQVKTIADLRALHQARTLTRLRELDFPAALPAIFAGLRISACLSVVGAIVGDVFCEQGDPA